MPEDLTIARKVIIEEYLSNWFSYEELATYLCLDIELIKDTLDVYANLDKSLLKKIDKVLRPPLLRPLLRPLPLRQ